MTFLFTPEEAQTTAARVADWLRGQQFEIKIESAVTDDAPYRTSLVANKGGFYYLIEAQGTPNYAGQLERFSSWLSARRLHCEFYIAVHDDSTLQGRLLRDIRKDGVGLLLVGSDGSVEPMIRARNPALVVTPDPTLALGSIKAEVGEIVNRFNSGERKDALRDLCELVERETQKLLLRLAKKGWISLDESRITRMNWSDQINALASQGQYSGGRQPILSANERDDLQSFRGARNLLDHKVRDRREEFRREQQFTERMTQGPRLAALLTAHQRKIK
jgi:hypothetical protein